MITADGGWRRGQIVPLKDNVDKALEDARPSRRSLVVRRCDERGRVEAGRDLWWHDVVDERVGRARGEGVRQRAPAVHPLHERHDRQAEGHPAHDRRLPDRRGVHDEAGVRPARRRHLLVHRRHRLGDRPQLRRLRPARQRRDGADVRGRAEPAGPGPVLGDHREVGRHHLLHGADGDPRVHAVGRPVAGEARSVVAAPARHGRRADQPRGVDVVPQADRRRPLPDRRHLVADRDRRDHDLAAARARPRPSRARRRARCPASSPTSCTRTARRARRTRAASS